MTEPGGSPGSGWDVRLDLGSVGTPSAGPRNASPTGDAAGTHARRRAGTSPGRVRADGAASGSSGSPDENVSARSNPPSPRDRSPRSRSPRPPSPSDEDDPHRAQQHSTPSPVARSVTRFRSSKDDATLAAGSRLDGMMGKLSAVRTGREASPPRASAAPSRTTPATVTTAPYTPSSPPNLGEPSRHALDTEQDERRLARRASRGLPRRETAARGRGASADSRRTHRFRRLGRPPRGRSPRRQLVPPQTRPKHANAPSAASLVTSATASRRPTVSPLFPNLPRGPRREIRQFPKRRRKRRRRRRRGNLFDVVAIASFRTRALRIETRRADRRGRDDESIFGTPRARPRARRRRRRRIGEKSTRHAPTRNPRVRVRSGRRVRTHVAVRVAGDVVRDASRDGRGGDRWRFRV